MLNSISSTDARWYTNILEVAVLVGSRSSSLLHILAVLVLDDVGRIGYLGHDDIVYIYYATWLLLVMSAHRLGLRLQIVLELIVDVICGVDVSHVLGRL